MSAARKAVESLTEKVEMDPDDRETLRRIARHRAQVHGWHPEDDSPFQDYSGYTVRDPRLSLQTQSLSR